MKRFLSLAVLGVGFLVGAGMTSEARADPDWDGRNARYNRWWGDYDRWYRGSYRPYYHHYHTHRYYGQPYYGRDYGTPRYGYRDYGDGGTVRVGPMRIYW